MSEVPTGVGASRLAGPTHPCTRDDDAAIEWRAEEALVAYPRAVAVMEARAAAIADHRAPELVWLLEHPPLYTAGTSAVPEAPAQCPSGLPVHRTGRGGQVTYHGPGQRVAYLMLDLAARRPDLRAFVGAIEQVIIDALARFGVRGERREDRVGVWVVRPDKPPGARGEPAEDKVAAIGIRVRRWVSFHGFSLNVDPDLSHYDGIVPCGIAAGHLGVTSLADLGLTVAMPEVDEVLRAELRRVFGPLSQREG